MIDGTPLPLLGAETQLRADAVRNRAAHAGLREAARRTVVERCDLQRVCLPQWRAMLSTLMEQPV